MLYAAGVGDMLNVEGGDGVARCDFLWRIDGAGLELSGREAVEVDETGRFSGLGDCLGVSLGDCLGVRGLLFVG